MNLNEKVMIYKDEKKDISKKSNKPYHVLELHDPETLENVRFFLKEDTTVNTDGLKFKDKVKVEFVMSFQFGQLQPMISKLTKL